MARKLPIDLVIEQLGYENSENLIKKDKFVNTNFSTYVKKILKEIDPYAVYMLNDQPFILFFDNVLTEDISFKKISKQVWNAQIPLVILCDSNTVKIFNGSSLDLNEQIVTKLNEHSLSECHENTDFSFWNITHNLFWEKYSKNYSNTKLNQVLLDNISYLTNELKNTYNIPFATKLVLRLIFIRYLIDRGVDLDYGNFNNDIIHSQKEFLKIIKSKDEIYKLFNHLKSKFNGNLFDLEGELDNKELNEDVFELLSNFFSGKEVLDSGQLSLFALYDFNIIPVELISNIYEILLGKEIREKDNAFYTPNYLVEYVLDNVVMKTLKNKKEFKVLDPACGSGVFLVDSFRRIIEENLNNEQYCFDDSFLNELLTNNIYGIDINEEAIDVTIFSLYLTILDYKDPKTLSSFIFPNLKNKNLYVADFFSQDLFSELNDIKFDFIIGNPPWGNVKHGLHIKYCDFKEYNHMQQNNEISRSFIFRAKDFCHEETICCFILHSKILYNQQQPAVNFRKFLLKNTKINTIIEMSSVRKLIFENATAPAIVMSFQYNNKENLHNSFKYISLKPNIFFKLFHVMVIEKNDVKNVTQNLLYNYDWAWKSLVYGSSYDLENILNLKKRYQTINDIILEQTPQILMGAGVEYHNGDQKDASHLIGRKLLDSQHGVDHFIVNTNSMTEFTKEKIHRPRDKKLFEPPYVLVPTGVNCENYKLKAAYSEESFVSRKTMYLFKGEDTHKDFLLNLVGLFNSSLYAYLNLLLGTSIGIEREQRFMEEVLLYPYLYSKDIVTKVEYIQSLFTNDKLISQNEIDDNIKELDDIILNEFKLYNNNFVDYILKIQIPQLTSRKKIDQYRFVTVDDLVKYSECFNKQFTKIYAKINKQVMINIYPVVANYYAIFELVIADEKRNSQIQVNDNYSFDQDLLTKFSVYEYNEKFYQIRDVIYFKDDSFFIIKPNLSKNWHPALAEIDMAEVIDQIMSFDEGEVL